MVRKPVLVANNNKILVNHKWTKSFDYNQVGIQVELTIRLFRKVKIFREITLCDKEYQKTNNSN